MGPDNRNNNNYHNKTTLSRALHDSRNQIGEVPTHNKKKKSNSPQKQGKKTKSITNRNKMPPHCKSLDVVVEEDDYAEFDGSPTNQGLPPGRQPIKVAPGLDFSLPRRVSPFQRDTSRTMSDAATTVASPPRLLRQAPPPRVQRSTLAVGFVNADFFKTGHNSGLSLTRAFSQTRTTTATTDPITKNKSPPGQELQNRQLRVMSSLPTIEKQQVTNLIHHPSQRGFLQRNITTPYVDLDIGTDAFIDKRRQRFKAPQPPSMDD